MEPMASETRLGGRPPGGGESTGGIPRGRHLLAVAVILLASAGVYFCTFDDGFINLDDDRFITRNPSLRSVSPASVADLFARPHFGAYHPLHLLSYAIEYRLAGRWRPDLMHIDNVAIHAANVLLVYLIFLTLGVGWETAILAAILFALHPTHVENVAWLSQRKDLLSLLFLLISFRIHVASRQEAPGRLLPWLSFAAFVLALLSKSSALTLPLVMIAYDRLLAGESWGRTLRRALPFLLAGGMAGVGMLIVQRGSDYPVGAIGGGAAAVVAILALGPAYAGLFLFPARLALFYPPPGVGASIAGLLAGNILLIGLLALLFRRRRALFCLVWAIATLLPTLSLIPHGHSLADRYLYIPSVGLCLLLALPVAHFRPGDARRTVAVVVLVVASILLGIGTVSRAMEWGHPRTLWETQIRRVPGSIIARNNLASVLQKEGDWPGVLALHTDIRAICELTGNTESPYYATATWKAGAALTHLDRLPEAREMLQAARDLRPRWSFPLLEMARLEGRAGRPEVARALLDEAREGIGPGDRRQHLRLAGVEAEILIRQGDPAGAVQVLTAAREEDPLDPDLPLLLGEAHLIAGDGRSAETMFRLAVREDALNLRAIDRRIAEWREEGRGEAERLAEIRHRIEEGRGG